MTTKELAIQALDIIKNHPNLASEINDLFQLAKDVIEEGGSEDHECELALESMHQLVTEKEDQS